MTTPSGNLNDLRLHRDDRSPSGRSRWLLWVLLLLVLVAAAAFVAAGRRALPVKVHTVVESAGGGAHAVLNASGYVVARRAATVSSKVTGKVVEVLVEEGMQVQSGQVLARLDDTNARAHQALAEASLETARRALAETRAELGGLEKELARIVELRRTQIASTAVLDEIDARVQAVQARLARQEAEVVVGERQLVVAAQEVEDTIIRSPFTGMAVSKNAQPGEMISPISAGGGFTRTGISTIVDMNSLEVEVDVNESYIHRVRPGQAVESTLDAYPEWKIPGKVIAVIPTADRQKATVKVRVGFDQLDPRILPEMGIKVAFKATEEMAAVPRTVSVPKVALRKDAGRDAVWVLRDGRVESRPVVLAQLQAEEALVSQGLTAGEKVVVEAPEGLAPGGRARENRR